VERINWPSFISQPIGPVLLYFLDWLWVVLSVIVIGHVWRIIVPRRFIWFRLADFGPIFVKLELITCPVTAVLIWQQGDYIGSVLALLWPIAINVIEFLLFSTRAIIRDHVGSGLWIGPIQERFMNALGYTRRSKDEVEESWERSDLI
jgi:hypothetical protein